MIRAQYAMMAEFQREGQSGNFDLLGIFDRVFTPAVPAQHPHLVLVVQMVTDDESDLGKKPFRLRCILPSGNVLFEQRGAADFKPAGGAWLAAARLAFEMNGMPLPEYGKYRFVLDLNGREVASHPLSVAGLPPK